MPSGSELVHVESRPENDSCDLYFVGDAFPETLPPLIPVDKWLFKFGGTTDDGLGAEPYGRPVHLEKSVVVGNPQYLWRHKVGRTLIDQKPDGFAEVGGSTVT
ncbi:hypothetical protein Ntsu_22470 [Nocardia sp. IFM 10818]